MAYRKTVAGAIAAAIADPSAPTTRTGLGGWIQGIAADYVAGNITAGSSLGAKSSILKKLIAGGLTGASTTSNIGAVQG